MTSILKAPLNAHYRINKLLLFFACIGLVSCDPDDKFTGVAAGARGLYVVTTYIVAGDTLFALVPGTTGYTSKINRIGVDNFTIAIEVIASDQLTVRTDYWRNNVRSTFSKEVSVRLTNYNYQFSLINTKTASDYEGSVGRFSGFFYERTVGGGIFIPPSDSLSSLNPSSSQDVVIIAQPAK